MRRVLFAFALAVLLGAPAPAFAQPPAPTAAQDEYVPLDEVTPSEQLPAAPLVLGAYAFIWVALVVYVFLLWRRLAAVQSDLDALRRRVPRG